MMHITLPTSSIGVVHSVVANPPTYPAQAPAPYTSAPGMHNMMPYPGYPQLGYGQPYPVYPPPYMSVTQESSDGWLGLLVISSLVCLIVGAWMGYKFR